MLTVNAYEIVQSDNYSSGLSLRFPRIQKVRLDGIDGYKASHEAESRDSLHKIYEAQCEQVHCVFSESENRFLKSESSGAGTKRKRTINKYLNETVDLSNVQFTTKALSGLTFTVYEGNYGLTQDFEDLGENEGWIVDAREIQCRDDLIKFIYKNGGTWTYVHCKENDYVLGGHPDDTRIVNHKKATTSENSSDVITSKCDNVFKWTFVFSLVSKWLERLKDDNFYTIEEMRQAVLDENQCIKKAFADILDNSNEHKI